MRRYERRLWYRKVTRDGHVGGRGEKDLSVIVPKELPGQHGEFRNIDPESQPQTRGCPGVDISKTLIPSTKHVLREQRSEQNLSERPTRLESRIDTARDGERFL